MGYIGFKHANSAVDIKAVRTVMRLWETNIRYPSSQRAKARLREAPPDTPKVQSCCTVCRMQTNVVWTDMPGSKKTPKNSLCDAVVNRWKMLRGYHMYSCGASSAATRLELRAGYALLERFFCFVSTVLQASALSPHLFL